MCGGKTCEGLGGAEAYLPYVEYPNRVQCSQRTAFGRGSSLNSICVIVIIGGWGFSVRLLSEKYSQVCPIRPFKRRMTGIANSAFRYS